MEWIVDPETIRASLGKYKWFILVLAIGLILMLFPGNNQEAVSQPQTSTKEPEQISLQQELEQLLSQLEGAGKVRVLLTESTGQQTIYQTDQSARKTMESEDIQKDTVILTGENRAGRGLVSRVDPPEYLGAVILCQGADKATVRLAVVEAVATATGLGADKISVCKMK